MPVIETVTETLDPVIETVPDTTEPVIEIVSDTIQSPTEVVGDTTRPDVDLVPVVDVIGDGSVPGVDVGADTAESVPDVIRDTTHPVIDAGAGTAASKPATEPTDSGLDAPADTSAAPSERAVETVSTPNAAPDAARAQDVATQVDTASLPVGPVIESTTETAPEMPEGAARIPDLDPTPHPGTSSPAGAATTVAPTEDGSDRTAWRIAATMSHSVHQAQATAPQTSAETPGAPSAPVGGGAVFAPAGAPSTALYGLLVAFAALALLRYDRLRLRPVQWRCAAFVALLERPG